MVGLDLHTQSQSEQDCTKNGLRQPFLSAESHSVGIYDSGKHPRKESYRLHFCVMADLNYLHVI